LTRLQVPSSDGLVPAGRHDAPAVGRNHRDLHPGFMPPELAQLSARGDVPQPNCLVLTGGQYTLPVGGEDGAHHDAVMSAEWAGLRGGADVPQPNRAVASGGKEKAAVGGKGYADNCVGVPREDRWRALLDGGAPVRAVLSLLRESFPLAEQVLGAANLIGIE